MICTTCLDAISPLTSEGINPGTGEKESHHMTYTGFKRSVDQGCYCCHVLWRSLSQDEKDLVSQYCLAESRPSLLERTRARYGQNKFKFVTSSLLSNGSGYGYQLGDHSFQLGIRGVQGDKESWTWRVPFILQPVHSGM